MCRTGPAARRLFQRKPRRCRGDRRALIGNACCCSRCFRTQSSIRLCDLVDIRNAFIDLGERGRLMRCRRAGFCQDLADFDNTARDPIKNAACFTNQTHSIRHMACADLNDMLDLIRRFRRPLRQGAHFACHDGEAFAGLTCARRLDACIQGQEVGLEGNAINQRHNLRDLRR